MKPSDVVLAMARIRATLDSLAYAPPETAAGQVFEKLVAPYLAQLAELQAQVDQVRKERDAARRALQVRDLEETGLYDMNGQLYD